MPVFISWCWIELRAEIQKSNSIRRHIYVPINNSLGHVGHSQFDVVVDCFFINMFNFVINFHYSSLITTSVAVIGSREHSHHRSIVLPLITLHDKLVSTCNKVKIVDMGELFCDILAEGVTSPSWRDSPTTSTRLREE